jgi:hypothetical protein
MAQPAAAAAPSIIWPGFVDALAQPLRSSSSFLVFTAGQFFMSDAQRARQGVAGLQQNSAS